MKKSAIFKEIGIVLMLLVAVALLLAIIFYDYIPSNKVVPVKIKPYEMSEDIKEELKESVLDGQSIVKTHYIDSADLDAYEAGNDYNKGKANPFADYTQKEEGNATGNNTANNNTNDNTNNNTNNNTDNTISSTGKNEVYINTPGKNY